MDSQRFRSLTPRYRALVALGLLFDGREAGVYLENDAVNGPGLKRAAEDVAALPAEQRVPFVGTLLRAALEELEKMER